MIIPGPKFLSTKRIELEGISKTLSVKGDNAYEVVATGGEIKNWQIGDKLVLNEAALSKISIGKEEFYLIHQDYVLGKLAN